MNILIVDDEAIQRTMLRGFLEKQGHTIFSASGGREALDIFMQQPVQLVLLDHRMEDMNGDEVFARMKELNPLVRAIMITAYGAVDTAVRVMRLGAIDFLEKPLDLELLMERINAIEENTVIAAEAAQVDESIAVDRLPVRLVGESEKMRDLLSMVTRAAPTPWTVLIRGETGTGKELIARLIHLLSPRKKDAFIELNCAAVPENLFESELFGHEKGAFTGAAARRRGMFELATNGTLFLDEIGELPLTMQAKLLRTLQEKKITRLGSETGIAIDTRIVAATNRNLKEMVAEGTFREDLYFRLNVIELRIPPLRQRKEDIPALIDFFLEKFDQQRISFSDESLAQLCKYTFPGNVRELEHILQRISTMARKNSIAISDLPPEIRNFRGDTGTGNLGERLDEVERNMLRDALEEHGWVQTRAADSLGISERVLRYKMKKAGLRRRG